MDISDLRVFAAVAQTGGITAAARRLGRVQSNVTTRIKQLEADLGVELFVRTGKRLQLGPRGRTLLRYAEEMLALCDAARAATTTEAPAGRLVVGAMDSAAAVRLPPVLGRLHARHPRVSIELRTGNPGALARSLLAGQIDAAFVVPPLAFDPFDRVLAFRERMAVVAPPGFDMRGIDPDDPPAMLVFEHGCPHRHRLELWYRARGLVPRRIVELGSYHALLGCVVAGMGVALVPESVLGTFPERKRLKVHRLAGESGHAETSLIWRRGDRSPNVAALVEALR
jgi:DNA-binding transcriptional LysR family regulator